MQGRNRDTVVNKPVYTVGEGEGRLNREVRIDIYTLPWVNQGASGNLLHSTGSSSRRSVTVEMGGMKWAGGREGTYVYTWQFHFVVQQKSTQHCKAIVFQLKNQLIRNISNFLKNMNTER